MVNLIDRKTQSIMAWNKYYIIVKGMKVADEKVILKQLKLDSYAPGEKVSIDASNKPQTL